MSNTISKPTQGMVRQSSFQRKEERPSSAKPPPNRKNLGYGFWL